MRGVKRGEGNFMGRVTTATTTTAGMKRTKSAARPSTARPSPLNATKHSTNHDKNPAPVNQIDAVVNGAN